MAGREGRPSEAFARRMRQEREARRWTQQELAVRLAKMGLALDRTAVARIETGKRALSLDEAIGIDKALTGSSVRRLLAVDFGRATSRFSPDQPLPTVMAWVRGHASSDPDAGRIRLLEGNPSHLGQGGDLGSLAATVAKDATLSALDEQENPEVRAVAEGWVQGVLDVARVRFGGREES